MLKANIKMRVNTETNPICISCGCERNYAVEMFDVNIGGEINQLCNFCMEELFNKSLKATCQVNGKLKSQHDLKIISIRGNRYGSKF